MTDALRCPWCGSDPLYVAYHDHEWGKPERDARALWESLILECFQAGLSWITILRRRETFRAAFEGFDPSVIAGWGEAEVARLLADPGIIRHRGKIEASVGNARAYLEIVEREGSFSKFVWSVVDGKPRKNRPKSLKGVPAKTPKSDALSKKLAKAGLTFVGPTICYAFMQASGMVDDHVVGCHCARE